MKSTYEDALEHFQPETSKLAFESMRSRGATGLITTQSAVHCATHALSQSCWPNCPTFHALSPCWLISRMEPTIWTGRQACLSLLLTLDRLELMAFGLSLSMSEANRKQQHTCPRSCRSKVCGAHSPPLTAAGWTKLEAIDSLLRKGGFKASITDDFRCKIKLTRYKYLKASATYAQWLASQGAT